MSREQTSKQEQIGIFGNKAKGCRTDHQKLNFSIHAEKAFFIDSDVPSLAVYENITKDLDDAFYVYANMKKLNETEFQELKSKTWREYPENLKIFLSDYCILNSDAYSKYFLD